MSTEPDQAEPALERLAFLLCQGRHAELSAEAARALASCQAALEELRTAARQGRATAKDWARCEALRRRLAELRALVAHAEQVGAGLQGILGMLGEAQAGAQYERGGEPVMLRRARKFLAEA
jgi:hypothetical protein